ncbi:MAG: DoxX family protein [Bacteroidetes bacterium]|nr:DoxX family protein [Bacteroidota bacterium]
MVKFFHWGDMHHPGWLDFLRIALGSYLFYKGIVFARDADDLRNMIPGTDFTLLSMFLSTYIPLAHFAGGLAIALGLITRWAVIFQLPILAAAIILNGMKTGMFDVYSEFWISVAVFCALLLFLVVGSGRFSADEVIRKYDNG